MADQGPIVAISSFVAQGTVGLRAIMPALQARKREAIAVPTILLPWHPGKGVASPIRMDGDGFQAMLDHLMSEKLPAPAAILSGWLADETQVAAVAGFVETMKARFPQTLYLCDPVIGDNERAYRPVEVIDAIADRLLPLADIATPNRFELQLLTGERLGDNDAIIQAGSSLGIERLVVTSAFGLMRGTIGTLLLHRGRALLAENRIVPDAPHGPGDLFSALFLCRLIEGQSDEAALSAATASVFEMLGRSARLGTGDLAIAAEQQCLVRPMAMVTNRLLAMPSPPASG